MLLPVSGQSEDMLLPVSGQSEDMLLPVSGQSEDMLLPVSGQSQDLCLPVSISVRQAFSQKSSGIRECKFYLTYVSAVGTGWENLSRVSDITAIIHQLI